MDNTIDTAVASKLIIGTKLKMKHATYMPNTFHPASSFKNLVIYLSLSPPRLTIQKRNKRKHPSVAPSFSPSNKVQKPLTNMK